MERKLHQEPIFDFETLRKHCEMWEKHDANKICIDWSTGTGPTVFYYPLGQRHFGTKWTVDVETYNYNEIYADYIENSLIPRMRETIESRKLQAVIVCVDLQPLLVQRQRRRMLTLSESSHNTSVH